MITMSVSHSSQPVEIVVQLAPQRWQDTPSPSIQEHDVVIAFEERIYDAVVEDLQTREPTEDFKAIHVICLDTKVRIGIEPTPFFVNKRKNFIQPLNSFRCMKG